MNDQPCSECGSANPADAKFCMSCGSALGRTCPSCGAQSSPDARFCMECGAGLGGPDLSSRGSSAAAEPEEERRRATVLFADLSNYTAVAERLDPEEAKDLVDLALDRLSREVTRLGGTVDKYIGDNVMAVFGAPVAHEDDPERAVRAGLAMQEAMAEINAEIEQRSSATDIEFALRVGINTGDVLAGAAGGHYTVIGDAVNVAARLQVACRPGAVTVGPSTRRLTGGAFAYRELEPLTLKGKSQAISAWEAAGVVAGDGHRGRTRGGAPLIGRDSELDLLRSVAERVARESRPHLVTIYGQAGVGKSRLLAELSAVLEDGEVPVEVLVGHSPAYGTANAYAALAEIIRTRFGIAEGSSPSATVAALRSGIAELGEAAGQVGDRPPASQVADRAVVPIARLLGVEADQQDSDATDPEGVRNSIFAAVRSVFELLALDSPVAVAIEDIHWADEGMLDLVEHLAGRFSGSLLIICLARDELLERRPSWGAGGKNATSISLDPLSGAEAGELVQTLLGEDAAGPEVAEQVAGRSGGNPLFAEELVNRLREGDRADPTDLPDTVHAVLAARLDALEPEERRLIQSASVIGQTFSGFAVAELSGEADADQILTSLVAKDLLVAAPESSAADESELTFKHALVRDVAYETLPRAVRARRHFEVGRIIEVGAGASPEGVTAQLAEHYGRAVAFAGGVGFDDEELQSMQASAARALEAAGDVAASLYSNAEAIEHYEGALALPGGLEPLERARVEERLGDTAFRAGHVDVAIAAWDRALEGRSEETDPKAAAAVRRKLGTGFWQKGDREASIAQFQRGIDMLSDGAPCRELVQLYEEAASLYIETGDNMLAVYAAEKAQRLADELGPSSAASRAHLTFGRVFGRIGDLERARRSLDRAVEIARQAGPAEQVQALLALGRHLDTAEADYPAAAEACEGALALADRLGDVPSEIELQAALGQLAVHRADWSEVDSRAAAAGRLAEREGLSGQLCLPRLLEGIAAWQLADWAAARTKLELALDIATAGGRSEVGFTAWLWLGACHRDRGDMEAASEALAEASAVSGKSGIVAQSAEALGAQSVVLRLAGRRPQAAAAATEAAALLGGGDHPIALAAATEARGVAGEEADALREAVALWERAGRPLNALRAQLLLADALEPGAGDEARDTRDAALREAQRLGVPHIAGV